MKVGFIGMGRMGAAMAGQLVAAGHDVAVYNRTPEKADALVAAGASRAATVADAARHGPVTITMLENDAALSAVALGRNGDGDGLVSAMPEGAIHVAMGTHGLALVKALDKAHAEAGQVMVSAPVMGRPPVADAGELGILAGGPEAAVATCAPLFAAMGRRTFSAGTEPAAAAAAKIAVNMLLACAIEAMGEAFALAEKCGVDGPSFLDILTDGLFAAPAYRTYGRMIAEKDYHGPAGFAATTGLKDMNLALAAGEIAGVPTPSVGVGRDRLIAAIARGMGNRDWTVMALEQARASGIAD